MKKATPKGIAITLYCLPNKNYFFKAESEYTIVSAADEGSIKPVSTVTGATIVSAAGLLSAPLLQLTIAKTDTVKTIYNFFISLLLLCGYTMVNTVNKKR